MNCPNCNQPVENGALFCGNCGQALSTAIPTTVGIPNGVISNVATNSLPSYAMPTTAQNRSQKAAQFSVLLGVAGIIGAVFIALFGFLFGIAGIITGIIAHANGKRAASSIGIVLSCLSIIAGVGVSIFAVNHQAKTKNTVHTENGSRNFSTVSTSASNYSTPCYSTNFSSKFNISTNDNDCDIEAYDAETLNASSNAYTIYANSNSNINQSNFSELTKAALEKDLKNNLPGFSLTNERLDEFAGSPAYIVNSVDKSKNIAVVQAVVLHKVREGCNVFILEHATVGTTSDLDILELQWQWK
ncbi:MAG TPA: zinc ribbon domain-containing protein [Candidatus Saccharimonadales bacterium]|nr:zinc ribbon domain-containing protein [Candidatus Saccharimonadales bacterium]